MEKKNYAINPSQCPGLVIESCRDEYDVEHAFRERTIQQKKYMENNLV